LSRKPRQEWNRPQADAPSVAVEHLAGRSPTDATVPVLGGVLSPAPEPEPNYVRADIQIDYARVVEMMSPPSPEVINTVKADEPIEPVSAEEHVSANAENAENDQLAFDENEPGRWIPGMASFDEATRDDPEWLGAPSISIRAGLTAALANPGPWPNAERLGRAQRHMEELINALPEAIEAANGLLKEDLETLRDILA
jgi:hypothetical protein